MNPDNILIVPKWTKYEWDQRKHVLSARELLRKYDKTGVDASRILKSHERQKKSLRLLKQWFAKARFVERGRLTRAMAATADLVISLGGDNHFQFVSHFLKETLVLGINSDPLTSEGSITTCTVGELGRNLKRLAADAFHIEEWVRIQVALNGKPLQTLAVSDVFLGEMLRTQMSRHQLIFAGKREEQKCSGLVVATGAGSSGWFDAACRFVFPKGRRRPKAERSLQFLATEPYSGRLSRLCCRSGVLRPGSKLVIRSLNDSHGVIVLDSQHFHPFREGSVAEIEIGTPLRVIVGWKDSSQR